MTNWKEYTGSDEQIAEIDLAQNRGVIVRWEYNNKESEIITGVDSSDIWEHCHFTHYLICNPHPLADMIARQAQTGQPVWIRTVWDERVYGYRYIKFSPTTTPNWNIPNAEYSFTPFDEVEK